MPKDSASIFIALDCQIVDRLGAEFGVRTGSVSQSSRATAGDSFFSHAHYCRCGSVLFNTAQVAASATHAFGFHGHVPEFASHAVHAVPNVAATTIPPPTPVPSVSIAISFTPRPHPTTSHQTRRRWHRSRG
jgi:hypothetical protein